MIINLIMQVGRLELISWLIGASPFTPTLMMLLNPVSHLPRIQNTQWLYQGSRNLASHGGVAQWERAYSGCLPKATGSVRSTGEERRDVEPTLERNEREENRKLLRPLMHLARKWELVCGSRQVYSSPTALVCNGSWLINREIGLWNWFSGLPAHE